MTRDKGFDAQHVSVKPPAKIAPACQPQAA